ncbi:MAG: LytTR family transcriptional regulator [Bacteroidales bacterium]|nr:LytTR family transcriptional regulator [Bacteroidales bacterium]
MKKQETGNSRTDNLIVHIANISGSIQHVLYIAADKEEIIEHLLALNGKGNAIVRAITPEDCGFRLSPEERHCFHVYENNHIRTVRFDDIVYLGADRCYCEIHKKDGKMIVVSKSMAEVERHLPGSRFIRIHKSYVLNREYINDIFCGKIILPDGKTALPIGRDYRKGVFRSLHIINSRNRKFFPGMSLED